MDFVRDDGHIVCQADLRQAAQFFRFPYPAHRVVGRTEDQRLGGRVGSQLFQLFVVHDKPAVFLPKRIVDHPAAGPPHDGGEGIIDRRLYQDAVPLFGKHMQGDVDARHHTGQRGDPGGVHLPAMPLFLPPANRIIERFLRRAVAQHFLFQALPQGLQHMGRAGKVRIRHPHGDKVLRHLGIQIIRHHGTVPFQIPGGFSVDLPVKINLHGRAPPFLHNCFGIYFSIYILDAKMIMPNSPLLVKGVGLFSLFCISFCTLYLHCCQTLY